MALDRLMINQNDKFIRYRYSITEFYIIINGVKEDFPIERIISFKIENYFEQATFPIFKITLNMEASKYFNIIKNKDNVKFKIRIQSFYVPMTQSSTKSIVKDIINDVFITFIDDDNSDFNKEEKKKANTYKDDDKLNKIENTIELFLFKDEIVNGLRSSINAVVENSDLISIVVWLLNKAKVNNILISPFDNNTIYNNIILPPQSIEKQLKYLNNNYGFHKFGSLIYFGLKNSYIINCNGLCTAYESNEWKETVIYILEKTNRYSGNSGAIKKWNENKFYINAPTDSISISSESVSENVISGVDATIINTHDNKINNIETNVSTIGETNKNIIYNNTSNNYLSETYSHLKASNSDIITLVLNDISLDAFEPNKAISIIFESPDLNKKYKGRYRVASTLFTFSGISSDFEISSAITLKRIK